MRIVRWVIKVPGRVTYTLDEAELRLQMGALQEPYTILEQEIDINFNRPTPLCRKVSERVFREMR